MKYPVKNVFIVGGTGFLGYYSALEFLKKGINVSSASIPDVKLGDWFPKQINIVSDNLDVFTETEDNLVKLFKGHDALVYAVGPDDRYTPPAPSYDFFHEKLVVQCAKVLRAAKKAGVKRVSVLNSYFAYFDRQAEFNGILSKHHPYIRVRREQAEACINEGEKGVMDVMILELPYIFGSMPGRIPLWKSVFLDRFDKMPAVFFPKGGTVMIHVRGIAYAVVASILNGEHATKYPIGDSNMKYKQMIRIMYDALNNKKKIINTPTWIAYLGGLFINRQEKKHGKQGGLDYAKLMTDIQSKDLFFTQETIDKVKSQLDYKGLGYDKELDVTEGIRTTIEACYPEKFPDSDPANQVKEDLRIIDEIFKKKADQEKTVAAEKAPKSEAPVKPAEESKPIAETAEIKKTAKSEKPVEVKKEAPVKIKADKPAEVKKEPAKAKAEKPVEKEAPIKAKAEKPAESKKTTPTKVADKKPAEVKKEQKKDDTKPAPAKKTSKPKADK